MPFLRASARLAVAILGFGAASGFSAEAPFDALNKQLPRWIRLGMDHRFRMEGYTAVRFREDNDDRWFLNRFRANVTLIPTSWWSFTFQGQDSRVFFKSNPAGQNPYINRTDLRMAFTTIGDPSRNPVAVRFGRQELAYGDERIIGAANWGNVARTFDAAKLMLHTGKWQFDVVSAAVVAPQLRGISHHNEGNNLHFVYGKWTNPVPDTSIEPYVIWRVGAGDALTGFLHQDRRVTGVRVAGKLPAQFDYTTEWVAQTGNVVDKLGKETVRAFAQHTVIRHTFEEIRWHPRAIGEFNYSSGDRDPGDHRSGTFDQIYPTPHEKYGLADQVGWQNVHHISGGVEANPRKPLVLRALVHDWYLAQARDGLYSSGGALVFRDSSGQSGRHIGEEVDIIAQYNWGPRYVGGGFGHLFPGAFLQAQSPGAGLNYIYLNAGYRF